MIRYQKQLQQNYIQMYRRNRDLERVMRELSLELQNRDLEDYEVHSGSNDIDFAEITATVIYTQQTRNSQTMHPCEHCTTTPPLHKHQIYTLTINSNT